MSSWRKEKKRRKKKQQLKKLPTAFVLGSVFSSGEMKGFKEKERGKTSSVIIILLSFIICQRCCGLGELDLDTQQRRHHGMKTKLAHGQDTFCLSDQHVDRSLSVSVISTWTGHFLSQ